MWSPEEIAAGAEVVVRLGTAFDVADPVLRERPDARGRVFTQAENAGYARRLRTLGGSNLEFIHMHRFELVARPLAAQPGFDPGFPLTTRRPYDAVAAVFDEDRSAGCRPAGCRLSDASGGRDRTDVEGRLRDLLDARSEPGRHRSIVY